MARSLWASQNYRRHALRAIIFSLRFFLTSLIFEAPTAEMEGAIVRVGFIPVQHRK